MNSAIHVDICKEYQFTNVQETHNNLFKDKTMKWEKIDIKNLPKGEVLAANFEKGTMGYKGKLIGYLDDRGICIICDSKREELENCTHYIDIDKFDI